MVVVLLMGKGVVGRVIVGGIFFPKLGLRFKALLILGQTMLFWNLENYQSLNKKEAWCLRYLFSRQMAKKQKTDGGSSSIYKEKYLI